MNRFLVIFFVAIIICPTAIGQTLPNDSVKTQTDSIFQTLSEIVVTANQRLIKLENSRIHLKELDQMTNDKASLISDSKGRSNSDDNVKDMPISPTFKDVGDVGVTGRIYF